MDFGVPADHKVKIKENEKRGKYSDLAKIHVGDCDTNYD